MRRQMQNFSAMLTRDQLVGLLVRGVRDPDSGADGRGKGEGEGGHHQPGSQRRYTVGRGSDNGAQSDPFEELVEHHSNGEDDQARAALVPRPHGDADDHGVDDHARFDGVRRDEVL